MGAATEGARVDPLRPDRSREQRRGVAVVVVCWLAVLVPTVPKAFHMGDTFCLRVAEHIRSDPLRPFSLETNRLDGPPLAMYWLALGMGAVGLSEAALHVWTAPFVLLAVVATYGLARRFDVPPTWATVLAVLNPAMLPSQNLMPDMPAQGLGLAALWLWIRGVDDRDHRLAALGATCAGLAVLAKYSAGVIPLLLVAYALWRRRARFVPWLAVPATLVALWGLQSWLVYGRVHFLARGSESGPHDRLGLRVMTVLTIYGACVFVGWPVLVDVLKRRWPAAVVALIHAAVALVVVGGWRGLFAAGGFLLVIPLTAGSLAVVRRKRREATPWARIDEPFLWAWMGVVILSSMVVPPTQAVRHHLLAIPPVVILALRAIFHQDTEPSPATRAVLQAAVGIGLMIGALVAAADWEWADEYRRSAVPLAKAYRTETSTVWTVGDWGWQHYAERAGMRWYAGDPNELQVGDVLIVPDGVPRQRRGEALDDRLVPIGGITVGRRIPLAVMVHGAGFYALVDEAVPYRLTRAPLERFQVYRVEK